MVILFSILSLIRKCEERCHWKARLCNIKCLLDGKAAAVVHCLSSVVDSYTHNIEAVSCDEALVDITEILAETRLTPDEFANAVRMEIKDQTKCAASVGIG